jgi:hypothetical protein
MHMDDFAGHLAPLLTLLPPELVGEEACKRMLAVGALLPAGFARQTFGFECPLEAAGGQADILVSAVRARDGAATLAATHRLRPEWASVAALGHLAEAARIDDAWLEFDLFGPKPEVPSLFCRPLYPADDLHALRRAVREAGAALTGAPVPEALIQAVMRVSAALPSQAVIFQLGAMRARPFAGVRVCINQIALDGILTLLAALRYPDADGVRALLVRFQPAVGDVTLCIDLTPDLRTQVGLEAYFAPSRAGRAPEVLLDRFLVRAIEDGACREDKAQALRTWQAAGDIVEGDRRFQRGVHHIKLVHEPGLPYRAKAYLALRQALAR